MSASLPSPQAPKTPKYFKSCVPFFSHPPISFISCALSLFGQITALLLVVLQFITCKQLLHSSASQRFLKLFFWSLFLCQSLHRCDQHLSKWLLLQCCIPLLGRPVWLSMWANVEILQKPLNNIVIRYLVVYLPKPNHMKCEKALQAAKHMALNKVGKCEAS